MPKFRKKPVIVEAFRFYVDPMPDWFMDKVSSNDVILRNCNYNRYSIDEAYCEIKTLEGTMIGNGGDWIIKGVNGELYPCKPDIFEKTYEPIYEEVNVKVNINKEDIDKMVQKLKDELDRRGIIYF